MNKKLGVGIAVIVVVAGSIYAAPYWTVYQMRNAIIANDAARFSEYVDFPALRENLKLQFTAKMMDQMKAPEAASNPFAALGSALAVGLVNRIVETMVTPSGVMFMLDRAKTKPSVATAKADASATSADTSSAPAEQKKPAEYALRYQDSATVRAQSKTAEQGSGAFIFKRDGLWSWKLSGIELPQ